MAPTISGREVFLLSNCSGIEANDDNRAIKNTKAYFSYEYAAVVILLCALDFSIKVLCRDRGASVWLASGVQRLIKKRFV